MSRKVKEREEKYGGRGARGEMRNRVLETEGGGEWIRGRRRVEQRVGEWRRVEQREENGGEGGGE